MPNLTRAKFLVHASTGAMILGSLLSPALLHSQQSDLRVRVEAGPSAPLAGALVALIDARNTVVVESLTGRSGTATLRAPEGRYRVRVRRIGYQPFTSDEVGLPHPDELRLTVSTPKVVLATVVVNAKAECGDISQEAATLSSVWEEIAKALRSSQLTAKDMSALGRARLYNREVGVRGNVLKADTTWLPAPRGRPFAAIDHSSLVEHGYVRGNEFVGWEYYGPDEGVLLSTGFARTHCFRVVREAGRKGQLGLAFDPAPRRRIADIKGVLWIDEETSELREIVFRFVNAGMVTRFESGGYTRFRRMASGAWVVSDWLLRMPKLESRSRTNRDVMLVGYFEKGGALDDR